ncbi:MAG: CoA-binding protein, partial [Betaproteobacteria bacterium]|nr:CoA-binding protein [Betaproteobacteria bacterium]
MNKHARAGLEALFRPESIAIVGASDSSDFTRMAVRPLAYLQATGYTGRLYPVNPSRATVRGIKAYPTVADIPDPVDAALILVPAQHVIEALRDCAAKGVKAAVIISGGFAEQGPDGRARQDEIEAICRASGMRVCGPNTNGLRNVIGNVSLGSSPAQQIAVPGSLGFVTQSGGLLSATVARFTDQSIGFSYFAAAGNQADLEVADYADFMLRDPQTRAVALYLEGVKSPKAFLAVADLALRNRKPLVALKVGASELAAKSALAHTASIAGSDAVFDAVCRRKGIVRVDDYDTLAATCAALIACPLPAGDGVGLMPISGGAMALISDHVAAAGLRVARLAEATRAGANAFLPGYPASTEMDNPFDISAAMILEQKELLRRAIALFAGDENIHLVVTVITELPAEVVTNLTGILIQTAEATGKPFLVLAPRGCLPQQDMRALRANRVPIVFSNRECTAALKGLIRFSEAIRASETPASRGASTAAVDQAEVRRWIATRGPVLSEHESKQLLVRYGIATTRETLATTSQEASAAAQRIGYPVALKVDSPDIPHKTEAGGVRLNLRDAGEVLAAFESILSDARRHHPTAQIRGVLVQEMVGGGRELIAGVMRDEQFGPT